MNKWVDVVFVQDYSEIQDESPEIDVSDRDALAEYLTQWDFGDETDAAHTQDGEPWGSEDMLSEHVIGGLTYTLSTHRIGYVSLNRRPLWTLGTCDSGHDPFDDFEYAPAPREIPMRDPFDEFTREAN